MVIAHVMCHIKGRAWSYRNFSQPDGKKDWLRQGERGGGVISNYGNWSSVRNDYLSIYMETHYLLNVYKIHPPF